MKIIIKLESEFNDTYDGNLWSKALRRLGIDAFSEMSISTTNSKYMVEIKSEELYCLAVEDVIDLLNELKEEIDITHLEKAQIDIYLVLIEQIFPYQ